MDEDEGQAPEVDVVGEGDVDPALFRFAQTIVDLMHSQIAGERDEPRRPCGGCGGCGEPGVPVSVASAELAELRRIRADVSLIAVGTLMLVGLVFGVAMAVGQK